MKSFFSRIQNKFDASYGGRYIETILHEISLEDDSVAKFLSQTRKKCHIETEYEFFIKGKKRIVDIAIILSDSFDVISLVEIKYDDHLSEKNHAQLKDYIAYCKLNSCTFTYLTQYYPPRKDLDLLQRRGCRHILFSRLASELNKKSTSQITKLFISYLEDRGLSMKNVECDSVSKLLVRLFNPDSEQGKIQGNKAMIDEIPDSLQALMNNISVLSQEISRYTEGKRTPAIDFRIWPEFKFTEKQLKKFLDDKVITGHLGDEEKYGGQIEIYAKSVIIDTNENKGDWLYLEYGYLLDIKKGSKDYKTTLYVRIHGKNFPELIEEKEIGNTIISNKDKCILYLSKIINSVSKSCFEKTGSTSYKKVLKTLSENSKKFI